MSGYSKSPGIFLTAALASGSAHSLASTTTDNLTSLTLTPQEWDIWATVLFKPAATTTLVYLISSVETANNVAGSAVDNAVQMAYGGTAPGAAVPMQFWFGPMRRTITADTTYFLNVNAQFGVSTMTAYGSIYARSRI